MNRTQKLTCSAVCLALAMILPFFVGQIPQIGQMLCPMHIPVLLCGFLCGGGWGAAVGFLAPLLRSVCFGMPAMYPNAVSMAFELCTYGLVSGCLYALLPKRSTGVYAALLAAMLAGRIVWGIARYAMAGLSGSSFPWSAFVAGAFVNAVPGIILQLVLIPAVVLALQKAKLIPASPV